MPRKKHEDQGQIGLLEARGLTAPCVPGIRDKVKAWRDGDDADFIESLVLQRSPAAEWKQIPVSLFPARGD
jgi:hypothetical protein